LLLLRRPGRRLARGAALLALALALQGGQLHAQTQAPGRLPMAGGDVTDLFRESGGLLLAATNGGGVFRSIDRGVTWQESSTGLGNLYVSSLDGDDQGLVLAGT